MSTVRVITKKPGMVNRPQIQEMDRLEQERAEYERLVNEHLDNGEPRDTAEWMAKQEVWG